MITRKHPAVHGRPRMILVVGVIAMLVAGCTSVVQGKPQEPTELERQSTPLTAAEVFGDITTVNWCTLLATASYPEGWLAIGKTAGLEYCDFVVERERWAIAVSVGHPVDRRRRDAPWEPVPARQLKRELVMERPERERDGCARALAFPDHISLQVTAGELEGRPPVEKMCEVVETTLEFVVDAVVEEYAGHFDEYDDASLARRNVCELVPDELIATARGTPEQAGHKSVSGHECTWIGDGLGPAVIVAVDTVHRPERDKQEPVAGRPTVVSPGEDGCLIWTDYADFPPYINTREKMAVVVIGAPNPEACDIARKIAKEVWSKLPN